MTQLTPRLSAAGVVLLAALAYANAVPGGFVLDDRGIILQHPLVQDPGSAWRAFGQPYWPAAVGGGQYRPLGILAFALDWRLAGDQPAWYHAVNIAWHALVTLLVFALGCRLLPLAGATLAAAVFAVHPVHVEAVANIVGRLELMAAAGVLGMLLLHARGSLGAPLALAFALLSKEHAVVAPVLALLFDAAASPLAAPRERRRVLYLSYAAILVAWGGAMAWALRDSSWSTVSTVYADADLPTRLRTVLTVVPHYLRLLVAPLALSADYEQGVITPATGLSAEVFAGAAILVLWGVAVVVAFRRDRTVAALLCVVPVALAPVANVVRVTGVALAERTLYLPSAAVALLAGWALTRTVPTPRVALAAGAVVCAAFAWRTWTRTPIWRDPRSFAIALVEEHPESYRGHWVAGRVFASAGDLAAADRELAMARRIYSRDVQLLRESARLREALGDRAAADALRDSAARVELERQATP